MDPTAKAQALASIRHDLGGLGVGLVLGALACYFVRPKKKATNAREMAQRWLAWGLLGSVSSGVSFWVRNYDKGGVLGAIISVVFFSCLAWGLGYMWGVMKFRAPVNKYDGTPVHSLGPTPLSGAAFIAFVGLAIIGLVAVSAIKSEPSKKVWWEEPGAVEAAMDRLGVAPFDREAHLRRLREIETRAEQGDRNSQFQLGKSYAIQGDQQAAVLWFTKAADQGYAPAQLALGSCYFCGEGVPQDEAKGADLYEKAAQAGASKAQKLLGLCYQYGWGKTKNPALAFEWFMKAAEQGDAEAQLEAGRSYLRGDAGVVEVVLTTTANDLKLDAKGSSDRTGAFWIRKAAEQGLDTAQLQMADLYRMGRGVPKDLEKQFMWLTKAAEQGSAEAQNSLAWAYFVGAGVKKDQRRAADWHLSAAKLGHAQSQVVISGFYATGHGVIKDTKTALAWSYVAKANADKLNAEQEHNIDEYIRETEREIGPEETLRAQELAKTLVPNKETPKGN